ncbi:T9SS type A sorting domain-containing protein, partial [Algibacter sp.]|nr:T9SS type A sorting domain-containing protein [Algibacter sp.]
MKKFTLLLLLTVLPFIGFTQVKDYTFDIDNDKEGWAGAGLDLAVASPNPAGGFLIADGKGAGTGFPQMRSETYSPLLAVASNQLIRVTIVAENATDQATWQFANLDEGSNNFGDSEFTEFTMPIVVSGSGTSTFEFDVARNLDNTGGGIEKFSLRAKVGGTPGLTGTLKIDSITITLLTAATENAYVSNPDFEAGFDTDWSATGPDITLSSTTGNGGGVAAQLDFTQDLTSSSNNNLLNIVHDFGQTVSPSEINATFDALSNNTGIQIQITIRTFDEFDTTVETLNGVSETVATANVWESFTYNKEVTQPFSKIIFRIRVKGPALMGDKVAIDNITSDFSYIVLGVDDVNPLENNVSLYPNPVQNVLNIKSTANLASISIY